MTAITIYASFIIIDKISEVDIFMDDPDANNVITKARNTILSGDNIMLFIIVGLSIFMIISSAMVQNHPAMFILSFVILLIAILVSAVLSNSFWTFSNTSTVLSTAAYFPKINFLMSKLPLYIAFMGMAALIAGYVGRRQ